MSARAWREKDHPRRPFGPGGGRFVHGPGLPDLPGGFGQAREIDYGELTAGDLVLHRGQWHRVHGKAAGVRGAYTDQGVINLPQTVIAAPSLAKSRNPDWAARVSVAVEGEAMNAAGYQWQGGFGPHDEALSRWLHEHSDINDRLRAGGAPDPEVDAALAPSQREMVLYRGLPTSVVPRHDWTDPSYFTTSASFGVAREYARQADGPGVVLQVRVPAGVGSAAIGSMPDLDNWQITDLEDSGEVLLQRGLHLRRTGRSFRQQGVRVVEVQAMVS